MYNIGIDVSSTNTAIVITDKEKNIIDYILIQPKDKVFIDRANIIIKETLEFLKRYLNSTDKIYLESPSFMSKGKVIDLAMLLGSIYYGAMQIGFSCILVTPMSNKKKYTGSGKATKNDMYIATPDKIKDMFSVHKKTDDLIDAYALSIFNS